MPNNSKKVAGVLLIAMGMLSVILVLLSDYHECFGCGYVVVSGLLFGPLLVAVGVSLLQDGRFGTTKHMQIWLYALKLLLYVCVPIVIFAAAVFGYLWVHNATQASGYLQIESCNVLIGERVCKMDIGVYSMNLSGDPVLWGSGKVLSTTNGTSSISVTKGVRTFVLRDGDTGIELDTVTVHEVQCEGRWRWHQNERYYYCN